LAGAKAAKDREGDFSDNRALSSQEGVGTRSLGLTLALATQGIGPHEGRLLMPASRAVAAPRSSLINLHIGLATCFAAFSTRRLRYWPSDTLSTGRPSGSLSKPSLSPIGLFSLPWLLQHRRGPPPFIKITSLPLPWPYRPCAEAMGQVTVSRVRNNSSASLVFCAWHLGQQAPAQGTQTYLRRAAMKRIIVETVGELVL